MKPFSVLCLAGIASMMLTATAVQAAVCSVIPIHAMVLDGGGLRYSIPLQIGSTTVETMLDTGSVGLRALPGLLKPGDASVSNVREQDQYRSGVHLLGRRAQAQVTFGRLSMLTPIQVVDTVSCDPAKPKCVASQVPQDKFLMGGGGNAAKGEGYKAIIGIGMHRSSIGNPLAMLGRRWLVILPLPGQIEPGQLIINPTPEEMQGFRAMRLRKVASKPGDSTLFWQDHSLQGCLKRLDNGQVTCGDTMLDTGATGFGVSGGSSAFKWPAGIEAHFSLLLADGSQFGQHFRVGDKSPTYVHFTAGKDGANFNGINSGLLTYFNNVVLYDQNAGVIALRARPH
ncbi:MAG: hypothetical protein GAK32_02017 [Pseudomonas fluorescens]|nr:MAG: hypothetical protein GAK32_02017 [Pseudomonas fluorescens]